MLCADLLERSAPEPVEESWLRERVHERVPETDPGEVDDQLDRLDRWGSISWNDYVETVEITLRGVRDARRRADRTVVPEADRRAVAETLLATADGRLLARDLRRAVALDDRAVDRTLWYMEAAKTVERRPADDATVTALSERSPGESASDSGESLVESVVDLFGFGPDDREDPTVVELTGHGRRNFEDREETGSEDPADPADEDPEGSEDEDPD